MPDSWKRERENESNLNLRIDLLLDIKTGLYNSPSNSNMLSITTTKKNMIKFQLEATTADYW